MLIAIVQNNTVIQVGEHTQLFPNVSFPVTGPDQDFMEAHDCLHVSPRSYNASTQKAVTTDPYVEGGCVYTVVIVDKTQEEVDAYVQSLAHQVRVQRDRLLSESDWTQTEDSPVNKPVWATYRQALRDITSQVGFPTSVTFPTPPTN